MAPARREGERERGREGEGERERGRGREGGRERGREGEREGKYQMIYYGYTQIVPQCVVIN